MKAIERADTLAFLSGGGEMGELMRGLDWSRTALGPPVQWPQSLRTAVGILLNSRYPMFIAWGRELNFIYNDGYRPIFGQKHPAALGQPFAQIWAEIWDDLLPLVEHALAGEPTWSEDFHLCMERSGYPEEVYFTFSYSPIPDESAGVGGMFCACTETTERVVGERRLRALRDLAARSTGAESMDDACARLIGVLQQNLLDIPFASVYVFDDARTRLQLRGAFGELPEDLRPASIDPSASSDPWPVKEVLESGAARVLEMATREAAAIPSGVWPESVGRVLVLPISGQGLAAPVGVLIAGASPRRAFDENYEGFFALVARQFSAALADVQAYEMERRRADALAEVDRAKTAFFSNVSHEFRTPLTLMMGTIEEVLAGPTEQLAGEARASIEVAHRNSLRLLRLVNTLLDFSRLEAGRAHATYEPTDLAALTADLASLFRSAVERAGMRLLVSCPDLGERLYVDRDLWEKILLNLLSNAFKYTFEGEIRVTARRVGEAAEISVADTGVGIPEEALPQMFERFHRVPNTRARTHEGTGIGLALVHDLVRLHGGSIGIRSRVGEGSTFTVTIPFGTAHLPRERIQPSRAQALSPGRANAYVEEALRWLPASAEGQDSDLAEATPAASATSDAKQGTVLLVDDNADMREYVRRILAAQFDVATAGDGAEALDAIRRERPDLVLTDIMMPRLDGFGLLASIRADARLRDLPVVLLSARAGEEARIEGRRAGADDYVTKPFGARELLGRIEATLAMAQFRRETLAALRASEAALRESDKRKDAFIATLSHELRNPLAPIRQSIAILNSPRSSASAAQRAREIIDRQSRHMSLLLDDLLDIARITRGALTLRKDSAAVAGIIGAAVEAARPLIESRRHTLTLDASRAPPRIEADAMRLSQVICNLLTNAAKYTDPGGAIALQALEDDGDLVIRVTDNGIGMRADVLPRVFEMFVQASESVDRSQGGLGIGLALVRGIVELHGGVVQAHSAGPGLGSEFTLRLPARTAGAAGSPRDVDERLLRVNGARRVLIADDNRDAAESLKILLELDGHDVHVVHDGGAALEAVRTLAPDVAILDIGMPGLNGFEVAERTRAAPWGRTVRLVALSGWGQEQDKSRSTLAGFNRHLTKPVSSGVLHSLMGEC